MELAVLHYHALKECLLYTGNMSLHRYRGGLKAHPRPPSHSWRIPELLERGACSTQPLEPDVMNAEVIPGVWGAPVQPGLSSESHRLLPSNLFVTSALSSKEILYPRCSRTNPETNSAWAGRDGRSKGGRLTQEFHIGAKKGANVDTCRGLPANENETGKCKQKKTEGTKARRQQEAGQVREGQQDRV